MRICMVVNNFARERINVSPLVENLQELGHDIQVISMWKPMNLELDFKVHGVYIKGNNPPLLPTYLRNLMLIVYLFVKTIIIATCEKIDIFHAHFVLPTGFPVVLACRLMRKPVIVSAKGSDLNIFSSKFLFKPFAKFTLKKANGILALSRGLEKKALKLGTSKERVFVIPNGIDTTNFIDGDKNLFRSKLNVKMEDKVVLFVGTIASYRRKIKRLEYLISVMKTVITQVPTVKLMVVGVSSLPHMVDLVSKLGIEKHVSFLGLVPYENMPLYYRACDVFVLPSIMEGLPTTVLEAMASAKPVIAMDIEGSRDLIENGINGFLVSLGDSNALAEKIIQVITNEKLALQLGKESRKIAETQYTWKNITKKTLNIYTKSYKRI